MDKSRQELVKALLPGVQRNPPKEWRFSDGRKPDKDTCRTFIEQELERAFGSAQRVLGGMEVGLQFNTDLRCAANCPDRQGTIDSVVGRDSPTGGPFRPSVPVTLPVVPRH